MCVYYQSKKRLVNNPLWTRFVSQGVVCLHCVGCGGAWTFTVIFLIVSRGSTLIVSLNISFA
jgi:hypothetical protein